MTSCKQMAALIATTGLNVMAVSQHISLPEISPGQSDLGVSGMSRVLPQNWHFAPHKRAVTATMQQQLTLQAGLAQDDTI